MKYETTSQSLTFNKKEYSLLFSAFEHICTALEAVNRLYVWPLLDKYEKDPGSCTKEEMIALFKEIDHYVTVTGFSWEEFCEILKTKSVNKSAE